MAMSRDWKSSVSKALREYNIRHRCLTSHAFIRNSSGHLVRIVRLEPSERAKVAGCINGIPLLYSTSSFAQTDYGLLFLWDQPVEMVVRAAATLQMRCNAGATLCAVYVAKAVRDKVQTTAQLPNHFDRRLVEQFSAAYFLNRMLKENIDV